MAQPCGNPKSRAISRITAATVASNLRARCERRKKLGEPGPNHVTPDRPSFVFFLTGPPWCCLPFPARQCFYVVGRSIGFGRSSGVAFSMNRRSTRPASQGQDSKARTRLGRAPVGPLQHYDTLIVEARSRTPISSTAATRADAVAIEGSTGRLRNSLSKPS
jgi:hypothetical protein